jgi:hypothetical protein
MKCTSFYVSHLFPGCIETVCARSNCSSVLSCSRKQSLACEQVCTGVSGRENRGFALFAQTYGNSVKWVGRELFSNVGRTGNSNAVYSVSFITMVMYFTVRCHQQVSPVKGSGFV